MTATISRQPVRVVPGSRPVCECLGCDETATQLLDCGVENGIHQLCEDHADSLSLAPNAGDWIAKHCVY